MTPCAACGGIDDVFVWQARRDAGLALVARLVASDATVFCVASGAFGVIDGACVWQARRLVQVWRMVTPHKSITQPF